ncbi:MAG: ribosome biogenesis GTP-binding protein YihA/YsxC [Armatimonadota bacterium]
MAIMAEFVTSAAQPDQFPKDYLPEIALAGRSNVGKSSLINCLLGKKGMARTSNTPGRTQTLNFYRVYPHGKTGKSFYLVDMPGYGYSAVNARQRAQWAKLIDSYLTEREPLKGVVQLVDLRHPAQPLDIQMTEWLLHYEHNFLVVGTKADKVAKTKADDMLRAISEELHVDPDASVVFSASTGHGKDVLWRWLLQTAGVV